MTLKVGLFLISIPVNEDSVVREMDMSLVRRLKRMRTVRKVGAIRGKTIKDAA